MTVTFDQIRLQEAKKTALKEKLKICAELASQLHEEVAKQFELETKLKAEDHWLSLRDTIHFTGHTSNVCKTFVTVRYVLRKKSLFKDAIVLHGTVYVAAKSAKYFHVEGPAKLDIDILNKYINFLSTKLADIKGS